MDIIYRPSDGGISSTEDPLPKYRELLSSREKHQDNEFVANVTVSISLEAV